MTETNKMVNPVVILMWEHDDKQFVVTRKCEWPYSQKSEVDKAAEPYKDQGVYKDTTVLIHHRSFSNPEGFDAVQMWQLKDGKLNHLWNFPIEGT